MGSQQSTKNIKKISILVKVSKTTKIMMMMMMIAILELDFDRK